MALEDKPTIAVFFGGRSPEHDVSIITGLQVLHAIDQTRYRAFPVYITPEGEWLTGDALAKQSSYRLSPSIRSKLTAVSLDLSANSGGGILSPVQSSWLGVTKPIKFDIALPAFHGIYGEDGQVQGCFEMANVPYVGMRTMGSAIAMDKVATKRIMQALEIPTLPYYVINRPAEGLLLSKQELKKAEKAISFPACIKPCHLGSSIGVARVTSTEELNAVLPSIFKLDRQAILEPFVENLVEYNVSVRCKGDQSITSAIECPKNHEELLDFKQKYMSSGNPQLGTKISGQINLGMVSLTREFHPKQSKAMEANIRTWATQLYDALGGAGAPRIDFLCNGKTGELWLNEINPFPGSLGFYLWEVATPPTLFTQLITDLIEEARTQHLASALPNDPTPEDARLFERTG